MLEEGQKIVKQIYPLTQHLDEVQSESELMSQEA